jgi:hypothetical protein
MIVSRLNRQCEVETTEAADGLDGGHLLQAVRQITEKSSTTTWPITSWWKEKGFYRNTTLPYNDTCAVGRGGPGGGGDSICIAFIMCTISQHFAVAWPGVGVPILRSRWHGGKCFLVRG